MSTETKRKIDLVTIPQEKRLKSGTKCEDTDETDGNASDTKSESETKVSINYFTIFPGDTESHKNTNKLIKSYIDVLTTKFAQLKPGMKKSEIARHCNQSIELIRTNILKIKETNENFFEQKYFQNLIHLHIDYMNNSDCCETLLTSNHDLAIELIRLTKCSEIKFERKLSGDSLRKKVSKCSEQIRKLKHHLVRQESAILSLDDMQHESSFTQIPKLQQSLCQLWHSQQFLLNRSSEIGLEKYRPFTYTGIDDSRINRLVEIFYSRHLARQKSDERSKFFRFKSGKRMKQTGGGGSSEDRFAFFSLIDLQNFLSAEIEKAQIADFSLTEPLTIKIYKDLIEENRARRQRDLIGDIRHIESITDLRPDAIPDHDDPELMKTLKANDAVGEEKLQKIVDEFKNKDFEKYGKHVEGDQTISSEDDDEEEEDEEEEDEDEENEDSDDGEEKEIKQTAKNNNENDEEDDDCIILDDDDEEDDEDYKVSTTSASEDCSVISASGEIAKNTEDKKVKNEIIIKESKSNENRIDSNESLKTTSIADYSSSSDKTMENRQKIDNDDDKKMESQQNSIRKSIEIVVLSDDDDD